MLLSIIRQNQKLAAKRNPAFDRNRFAKFLIYFMVAFWAAYLIFIGVMLSFAFEDIFPSMEPYHIMNQGLIYGSPDKPGGLSIQLCKSEKKEFYIRYSS